jgi:hypothetical protein
MASAPMPAADSKIASSLQTIPQVEAVYVLHAGEGGLRVLTVVNDENEDVYERIYRKELQVAESFPSILFDFNVVARRGRAINSIVGNNLPVWARPTSQCPQFKNI